MRIATLADDAELRLLELRHAPALREAVNANRDRLYWVPADMSAEDAVERVKRGLNRLVTGEGFDAGIFLGGEFVGLIGLLHVRERTKSGELGYWLDRKAEGHGLVSRGCAAMIDYAFDELGLRRLEIKLAASNSRSRAVPERLGFTLEGTSRQAEPVGDRWEDLLVFGLLASEWIRRSS